MGEGEGEGEGGGLYDGVHPRTKPDSCVDLRRSLMPSKHEVHGFVHCLPDPKAREDDPSHHRTV